MEKIKKLFIASFLYAPLLISIPTGINRFLIGPFARLLPQKQKQEQLQSKKVTKLLAQQSKLPKTKPVKTK